MARGGRAVTALKESFDLLDLLAAALAVALLLFALNGRNHVGIYPGSVNGGWTASARIITRP